MLYLSRDSAPKVDTDLTATGPEVRKTAPARLSATANGPRKRNGAAAEPGDRPVYAPRVCGGLLLVFA